MSSVSVDWATCVTCSTPSCRNERRCKNATQLRISVRPDVTGETTGKRDNGRIEISASCFHRAHSWYTIFCGYIATSWTPVLKCSWRLVAKVSINYRLAEEVDSFLKWMWRVRLYFFRARSQNGLELLGTSLHLHDLIDKGWDNLSSFAGGKFHTFCAVEVDVPSRLPQSEVDQRIEWGVLKSTLIPYQWRKCDQIGGSASMRALLAVCIITTETEARMVYSASIAFQEGEFSVVNG